MIVGWAGRGSNSIRMRLRMQSDALVSLGGVIVDIDDGSCGVTGLCDLKDLYVPVFQNVRPERHGEVIPGSEISESTGPW